MDEKGRNCTNTSIAARISCVPWAKAADHISNWFQRSECWALIVDLRYMANYSSAGNNHPIKINRLRHFHMSSRETREKYMTEPEIDSHLIKGDCFQDPYFLLRVGGKQQNGPVVSVRFHTLHTNSSWLIQKFMYIVRNWLEVKIQWK